RRAMSAEWEHWSGTHPGVSEDFPAIANRLASEADAIQLELVAKRLTEIIDPDESKEAFDFIEHLAVLDELLVDMERYAE
ncbi:MAG: hypothetical protein O7B26_02250, partial [Planctomycetota bacterium]|nr:hypothetical protein [Planctomycetota bacterium]